MFCFLEASWDILAWAGFSWLFPQIQVPFIQSFCHLNKFSLLLNKTGFFYYHLKHS